MEENEIVEEVVETAAVEEVVENNEAKPENEVRVRGERSDKTDRNSKGGKFGGKFDKKNGKRRDDKRQPRDDMERKTVCINRVSKSVKGGKILNFSALVVVGDKNGHVGVGSGKSRETADAVERAFKNAKKHLITVPMVGTTIPHATIGKFGTSQVLLLPAGEGNGIIAGGAARAVVELAGIRDITTKLHGSTNKANCVKATLEALKTLKTKEEVSRLREVSIDTLN